MKYGIDISDYQSGVNYDEVAKNVNFAILKVGYGVSYMPDEQRDSELDNHYNGLKGKIPLGAYYYAYGTDYDSGRKEAENCLAYMGEKKFELPIYYDMEESRNTKEAGQGFVDRIREAGLKCGIYCSISFYYDKGLANVNNDSKWIAMYGSNDGNIPSEPPSTDYDIWQYTSAGYVGGLEGRIDMNIADDSFINNGQIRYKAHIQNLGWSNWTDAGTPAGTTGESLQMEAIIIEAPNIQMKYRAHVQDIGWMDFVNQGEVAGTTGQGKRLEALEIQSSVPLKVSEHIEGIGWLPASVGYNVKVGTEGKSLRMEAIKIELA